MQGAASSASSKGNRGERRAWSPTVVLVIVLGATLVAQFATYAILGAEATGTSQNHSCAFSFWVFNIGCSDTTVPNSNAYAAQQLANSLTPWFVGIDVIFILAVVYVVVTGRGKARAGGSGHQIGAGAHARRSRR